MLLFITEGVTGRFGSSQKLLGSWLVQALFIIVAELIVGVKTKTKVENALSFKLTM